MMFESQFRSFLRYLQALGKPGWIITLVGFVPFVADDILRFYLRIDVEISDIALFTWLIVAFGVANWRVFRNLEKELSRQQSLVRIHEVDLIYSVEIAQKSSTGAELAPFRKGVIRGKKHQGFSLRELRMRKTASYIGARLEDQIIYLLGMKVWALITIANSRDVPFWIYRLDVSIRSERESRSEGESRYVQLSWIEWSQALPIPPGKSLVQSKVTYGPIVESTTRWMTQEPTRGRILPSLADMQSEELITFQKPMQVPAKTKRLWQLLVDFDDQAIRRLNELRFKPVKIGIRVFWEGGELSEETEITSACYVDNDFFNATTFANLGKSGSILPRFQIDASDAEVHWL